jgi:septum formation protein
MRLILASASPRRAELLTNAGYAFEVRAADIDEQVRANEAPEAYVRRLAREKSAAVAGTVGVIGADDAVSQGNAGPESRAGIVVVAADTAVVVDALILGKPVDENDAADMLRRLSGRPHEVLTGVSVRCGHDEVGSVERTSVWMAPLSPDEIAWYVASGEGTDKAGGYAIQGLASRFIPRIEGSYSNVVGLPVRLVGELIREVGGDPFEPCIVPPRGLF